MAIESGKNYTFTIARVPRAQGARKTIQRLMRMRPDIQSGLKKLSRRRRQGGNDIHQRGGRMWTSRIRATKLAVVLPGESFTLHVTPQLLPDLQSVEKYLEVKKG